MEENATVEKALKQINDKGYLIPYNADGRKLVKTGQSSAPMNAELVVGL